jgi:hypothetical protein
VDNVSPGSTRFTSDTNNRPEWYIREYMEQYHVARPSPINFPPKCLPLCKKKPPQIVEMNGNDTFLDVNDAHLRVTSGNVYASAFNLDQIDIVMSSNTASTVNFNNPTKAFNAASNIEVGTANLFVDTTTTRVGVGTASPATTLDVAGDLNVQW